MAATPNYAAMATGAGFVDFMARISYAMRHEGDRTFDDAYTFLSTGVVSPINEAEIYSVIPFPHESNTSAEAAARAHATEIFRVSRMRSVGAHIISSHFLNLVGTKVILIDRIHYDYHDWLRRTFQSYVNDLREENIKGTWAYVVSKHLLDILPGVISGLLSLFKAKTYHGDLLHGVALKRIDNKLVGYLYNMKVVVHKGKGLRTGRSHSTLCNRDIDHIIDLIDYSVKFGYADAEVERSHTGALADSPLYVFRSRILRLRGSSASPSWIINDPTFWTVKDQSKFMKKLYDCLYSRQIFRPSHLEGVFTEDWYPLCMRNDSRGLLRAVYDHGVRQDPTSYSRTTDIVRFWRHAKEHLNERLKELEGANANFPSNRARVAALEAVYPFASHCHRRVEHYFLHNGPSKYRPPPPDTVNYFRSEMGW